MTFVTGKSDLWNRLLNRRSLQNDSSNNGPVPNTPSADKVLLGIKSLLHRSVKLYFVYSGGPAFYNYIENYRSDFQFFQKLDNFHLSIFRKADHTFTLLYYQEELIQSVTDWIGRLSIQH